MVIILMLYFSSEFSTKGSRQERLFFFIWLARAFWTTPNCENQLLLSQGKADIQLKYLDGLTRLVHCATTNKSREQQCVSPQSYTVKWKKVENLYHWFWEGVQLHPRCLFWQHVHECCWIRHGGQCFLCHDDKSLSSSFSYFLVFCPQKYIWILIGCLNCESVLHISDYIRCTATTQRSVMSSWPNRQYLRRFTVAVWTLRSASQR